MQSCYTTGHEWVRWSHADGHYRSFLVFDGSRLNKIVSFTQWYTATSSASHITSFPIAPATTLEPGSLYGPPTITRRSLESAWTVSRTGPVVQSLRPIPEP